MPNARAEVPLLRKWDISSKAKQELQRPATERKSDTRALTGLIRMARTLADLRGSPGIGLSEVAVAMSYNNVPHPGSADQGPAFRAPVGADVGNLGDNEALPMLARPGSQASRGRTSGDPQRRRKDTTSGGGAGR